MSNQTKKKEAFISKPLLIQSIKSNWMMWVLVTSVATALFIIINLLIGSKAVFTNIDMDAVNEYAKDEGMSWLKILGLLQTMGFSLTRIQAMSQMDMNAIFNDMIYKVAGVILPVIYVVLVCNKLVAAQVNDGSMAYILSTPTNRKTVIRTQFIFVMTSILLMYSVITVGVYAAATVGFFAAQQPLSMFGAFTIKTLLLCLSSFAAMTCLTGISFGASAYFNKSNQSIAVGGGICVLSLIGSIMGIFGSDVFCAVGVGVPAMKFFNYVSFFAFIDTGSISALTKALGEGSQITYSCLAWAWEIPLLFVVGGVASFIGGRKFIKKDLPL